MALVNDYDLILAGLTGLLAPYPDRVTVIDTEIEDDPDTRVDIAIYDAFGGGLDRTTEIAKLMASPAADHVVVFSFSQDDAAVEEALALGVHGYLSKALPVEQLVEALERVVAGERVVELGGTDDEEITPGWPGRQYGLTSRESEVLALICQGLSNEDIAHVQFLSINTVKSYIRSTYRRIGVTTRAQAVAWALTHGFGRAA